MKCDLFSPKGQKAFTLVELLIVIGIIAVLASLGFTVQQGVQTQARKLQTRTLLTNLKNAIMVYEADYQKLPPLGQGQTPTEDMEISSDSEDFKTLLEILVGENDELNPRRTVYLQIQNRDYRNSDPNTKQLWDAWRNPIRLVLDYDYDNRLRVEAFTELVGAPGNLIPDEGVKSRVAAWSQGPNGQVNAQAKAKDFITTWQ